MTEENSLSEENDYFPCFDPDDEPDEEDLCDYTGEECFGDPMFCEECPVLLEEYRKQSYRKQTV